MEIAAQSHPVFDQAAVDQLLNRKRGVSNLFFHLFDHFRAEVPQCLSRLRELSTASEPSLSAISDHSHKLKGMAAVLGARRLWSLADTVNQQSQSGSVPKDALLDELDALFAEYIEAVEPYTRGKG